MSNLFDKFNKNDIFPINEDSLVQQLDAIEENDNFIINADDDELHSFQDSEQFEDDSSGSILSESASLHYKWRGWTSLTLPALQNNTCETLTNSLNQKFTVVKMIRLEEIAARKVARSMSFETIEMRYKLLEKKKIPECLFLLILRQSFPDTEENIWLYSCLENTSIKEIYYGESLYKAGAVNELFQIGYHITAIVKKTHNFDGDDGLIQNKNNNLCSRLEGRKSNSEKVTNLKNAYHVSIQIDKCKIISCTCSCLKTASWCEHIVAVAYERMYNINKVQFRVTVWDSITSLNDNQVKKLAQYLINELPREYLTVAQKLIDNLQDQNSEINQLEGAPDPTADGNNNNLPALWFMNEKQLHENIQKFLINFMRPAPTVHCDVQFLSSTSPPASNEWNVLLHPLRSKEPEALWNLLEIVREMLKRNDENASSILHIITEDCIRMDTVLLCWYQTSLTNFGLWRFASQKSHALQSHVNSTQYNIASLCDEIVRIWRLVALNPKLTHYERNELISLFQLYHRTIIHRLCKLIGTLSDDNYYRQNIVDENGNRLSLETAGFTERHFCGFISAIRACYMTWDEPEIQSVINDLNFFTIQKILKKRNNYTINNNNNDEKRFKNLPLLRDGPEFIFGKLPDFADVWTNHLQKSKKKASKTKKRKIIQKNNFQKNFNQYNVDKQILNKNNKILNESEDSIPDDVEEDMEQENNLYKKSSKNQAKVDKNFLENRHTEELNNIFSNAKSKLNFFETRFIYCEALMTHGYYIEAYKLAFTLAQCLLQNPLKIYNVETCNSTYKYKKKLQKNIDVSDNESLFSSCEDECAVASTMCQSLKSNSNFPLLEEPSTSHGNVWNSSYYKPHLQCNHLKRVYGCNACNVIFRNTRPRVFPKRKFIPTNAERLKASELVVSTLSQTIFLVKILTSKSLFKKLNKNVEFNEKITNFNSIELALKLSLKILRSPRGPAATKFLEVLTYYLERKLMTQIQAIEISKKEFLIIKEFANDYLNGLKKNSLSRITVPPLTMANYLLDALSGMTQSSEVKQDNKLNINSDDDINFNSFKIKTIKNDQTSNKNFNSKKTVPSTNSSNLNFLNNKLNVKKTVSPEDEDLALKVALETLGMRVFISEADHPMLCECIRRQRADLSVALLVRNRTSVERLGVILDKVLDSSIHQMYSDQTSNACYFFNQSDPQIIQRLQTFFDNLTTEESNLKEDNKDLEKNQENNNNKNEESINKKSTNCFFDNNLQENLNNLHLGHDLHFWTPRPSEAQAHFIVELAKRVYHAAGGNQSNTMFDSLNNNVLVFLRNNSNLIAGNNQLNSSVSSANRNLYICSFLMGLYGLGLNNLVSSTWPTRTYSTNVCWIQGLALEIGRTALEIVRKTWKTHLTPTEVAALADKASQSGDPGMVEEGAYLALSILPKAYALTAVESKKALNQCKEQSSKLLEQACIAVERAAEKNGVYPEVLFKVAHHWYNLHLESISSENTDKISVFETPNTNLKNKNCSFSKLQNLKDFATNHDKLGLKSVQNSNDVHYHLIQTSITQNSSLPVKRNVIISAANRMPSQYFPIISHFSSPPAVLFNSQNHSSHNTNLLTPKIPHYSNQIYTHTNNNSNAPPCLQQNSSHFVSIKNTGTNFIPTTIYPQNTSIPIQSNQYNYMTAHYRTALNIPHQPQQYVRYHQKLPTHSQTIVENTSRLHLSHSAPNLLPNGQPLHPPSMPNNHMSQPPMQPMSLVLMHQQPQKPQNYQMYKSEWDTQQLGQCKLSPMLPQIPIEMPPVSIHQIQQCHVLPYSNLSSTYITQPFLSHLQNGYSQLPYSHQMPLCNSQNTVPILHSQPQTTQSSHQTFLTQSNVYSLSLEHEDEIQAETDQKLPIYLANAHRIGMRAMDLMEMRNSDDSRSFSKYSRNPSFSDEIRWLFDEVSIQLGDAYVHSFCEKVSTCVASPFLLYYIAKEAIKHFKLKLPTVQPHMLNVSMPSLQGYSAAAAVASLNLNNNFNNVNNNLSNTIANSNAKENLLNQTNVVKSCSMQLKNLMIQQAYPHSIAELMRNCVEMLYEATYNKLNHSRFTDADIDDTCELALTAREVFSFVPHNGKSMFDNYVRFARMQKSCKKDVVQRVNEALHQKTDSNESPNNLQLNNYWK